MFYTIYNWAWSKCTNKIKYNRLLVGLGGLFGLGLGGGLGSGAGEGHGIGIGKGGKFFYNILQLEYSYFQFRFIVNVVEKYRLVHIYFSDDIFFNKVVF